MDSATSDTSEVLYLPPGMRTSIKTVVVGRHGVGKTSFTRAVSEIKPLTTDETMTVAGIGVDTLMRDTHKETTTVAFDFGRITLDEEVVMYLYGAPGQRRFKWMLDVLLEGAFGGIAMVDTRDLQGSWDSIGRLEEADLPYVVAVNQFEGEPVYPLAEVREALNIEDGTPLLTIDARYRQSAKDALIALAEHLIKTTASREPVA